MNIVVRGEETRRRTNARSAGCPPVFVLILSLLASPVMADRVVIVWPEIGDYLSILPTSAKSVFSAPFLSRRTISGEKSGNNRRGSSSLGRVIKLMIRGGARAARIREQSTEEGEQIEGEGEGEEGVDDGNRPSMSPQSHHPNHMWAFIPWPPYHLLAISHSFAASWARAQGNDLWGLAGWTGDDDYGGGEREERGKNVAPSSD